MKYLHGNSPLSHESELVLTLPLGFSCLHLLRQVIGISIRVASSLCEYSPIHRKATQVNLGEMYNSQHVKEFDPEIPSSAFLHGRELGRIQAPRIDSSRRIHRSKHKHM